MESGDHKAHKRELLLKTLLNVCPFKHKLDTVHTRVMSAAVCLSGSLRTLDMHCVGALTMERIVQPIDADLYAFVNVPVESNRYVQESADRLVRALAHNGHVRLKHIEVDNNSPNDQMPGYHEVRGLKKCWKHTGAHQDYDWIVRVRTDVYYGFRLAPLPKKAEAGVGEAMYAGFVGKPGCANGVQQGEALRMDDRMDDGFAVLHGPTAQRAFLKDFPALFEREHERLSKRLIATNDYPHYTAPECLVGRVLRQEQARLNITDVRYMIIGKVYDSHGKDNWTPCARATSLIVRRSCDEVARAHWTCPIADLPGTVDFKNNPSKWH